MSPRFPSGLPSAGVPRPAILTLLGVAAAAAAGEGHRRRRQSQGSDRAKKVLLAILLLVAVGAALGVGTRKRRTRTQRRGGAEATHATETTLSEIRTDLGDRVESAVGTTGAEDGAPG